MKIKPHPNPQFNLLNLLNPPYKIFKMSGILSNVLFGFAHFMGYNPIKAAIKQGDMVEYRKSMSNGRAYQDDQENLLELAVESNSLYMTKQVHKDFPEYPFTPKVFHSAIQNKNSDMLDYLMETCPREKWSRTLYLGVQLHPSVRLMDILLKHGCFDGIDIFHIGFAMRAWSFPNIVWIDHRFEIGCCDHEEWSPVECHNENSYFYLVSKDHKDFWTTEDGDRVLKSLDCLYSHCSPCPLMDPRANLSSYGFKVHN